MLPNTSDSVLHFKKKNLINIFFTLKKLLKVEMAKRHWTLHLQGVVIGKAREIYTQLSFEHSSDYHKVKQLILKAYELVPEAYRQKFRNCRKENDQTHVKFAITKEQMFDRWCSLKKIGTNYPKLRQLKQGEEFKRCINADVKSFLDEKEVETLEQAARLADDYTLTHKVSFVNKANPRKPFYTHSDHKPSPSLVSSLVHVKPIRMLPNPNLLVKTKVTVPYLSLFALIANSQVILFLIVLS